MGREGVWSTDRFGQCLHGIVAATLCCQCHSAEFIVFVATVAARAGCDVSGCVARGVDIGIAHISVYQDLDVDPVSKLVCCGMRGGGGSIIDRVDHNIMHVSVI